MKQTISQFEGNKFFEKLDEDELTTIKGGGWWEEFLEWLLSYNQGCPPEDNED